MAALGNYWRDWRGSRLLDPIDREHRDVQCALLDFSRGDAPAPALEDVLRNTAYLALKLPGHWEWSPRFSAWVEEIEEQAAAAGVRLDQDTTALRLAGCEFVEWVAVQSPMSPVRKSHLVGVARAGDDALRVRSRLA